MATALPMLAAGLVMAALDALWLGVLARSFYQQEIGGLLRAQPLWQPALLFYVGYPIVLTLLALNPWPPSLGQALWRCALVGVVAYGAYDLTNLATLKGFTSRVAVVDFLWGVFATSCAGLAAYGARQAWQTWRMGA